MMPSFRTWTFDSSARATSAASFVRSAFSIVYSCVIGTSPPDRRRDLHQGGTAPARKYAATAGNRSVVGQRTPLDEHPLVIQRRGRHDQESTSRRRCRAPARIGRSALRRYGARIRGTCDRPEELRI